MKELRAKTGMSRREFYETFGVPERTLQNWEEGKRKPPEYVVKLLKMAVEKYLEEKENFIMKKY